MMNDACFMTKYCRLVIYRWGVKSNGLGGEANWATFDLFGCALNSYSGCKSSGR